MAYSDDTVRTKLSSLNETQDSIVTVAQWLMFHRRYADRTASLWFERMRDTVQTAKRLNLIYLANEVVQQSRARSKQDFLLAFEPLIADATALAYKGASQEVQGKLRRVVEVWRQRSIFDARIQEQAEKRLDELDKEKGSKSGGLGTARLGGSLFGGGGGVPPELERASRSLMATNKAEAGTTAPVTSANAEYTRMTDPNTPLPSAPVRCAKLRGLIKDLMAAQNAVEASMKARSELIANLEAILDTHRAKLDEESEVASSITMKVNTIEIKAREVEDSIMRGQDPDAPTTNGNNGLEISPETEGFTPPPPDVETFTPPAEELTLTGDPVPTVGDGTPREAAYLTSTGADVYQEQPPNRNEPPPAFAPPLPLGQQEAAAAEAAKDFLQNLLSSTNHLSTGAGNGVAASDDAGDPRLKRRKLSHKAGNDVDEEIFGDANVGGVDEEGISAMLGE